MRRLLLCTAVLLAAATASAADPLTFGDTGYLRASNDDSVPVFKDAKAQELFDRLIRENGSKLLAMRQIVCIVKNGAKVIVESKSAHYPNVLDVRVIDGPKAGCRGSVLVSDVSAKP